MARECRRREKMTVIVLEEVGNQGQEKMLMEITVNKKGHAGMIISVGQEYWNNFIRFEYVTIYIHFIRFTEVCSQFGR